MRRTKTPIHHVKDIGVHGVLTAYTLDESGGGGTIVSTAYDLNLALRRVTDHVQRKIEPCGDWTPASRATAGDFGLISNHPPRTVDFVFVREDPNHA